MSIKYTASPTEIDVTFCALGSYRVKEGKVALKALPITVYLISMLQK